MSERMLIGRSVMQMQPSRPVSRTRPRRLLVTEINVRSDKYKVSFRMFSHDFEPSVQREPRIVLQSDLAPVFEFLNEQAARYNMRLSEIGVIEIHLFNSQEERKVRMSLKFCVHGLSIEKCDGNGSSILVFIGCQEYPQTIIIFECTFYISTSQAHIVLPIPSRRTLFPGES
jgi:hypothetical protein